MKMDVDPDLYLILDDIDDPYPMWAEGRRNCPVQHAPGALGRDTYVLHRRADVEAVLRDGDTFSSRVNDDTMGPIMGRTILAMDGAEHRRHRDLVARAFRASSLQRWADEVINPSVHGLLDQIAPQGEADLVAELTARFPVQVIAAILGVP